MTDEYYVKPCEFTCAKKFMESLDETDSMWLGGNWIFRGQPEASKCLLPTAFRDEFMDNCVAQHVNKYVKSFLERQRQIDPPTEGFESETDLRRYFSYAVHVAVEKAMVWTFERLADRANLPVPEERASFWGAPARRSLNFELQKTIDSRPRYEQLHPSQRIFALARHHGIPSRLLDWTIRPYFAAYFAADGQFSNCAPMDMVVWAVNLDIIEQTHLTPYAPLRAPIGFLKSQQGLFVFDRDAHSKFHDHGRWQPFEFELSKLVEDSGVHRLVLKGTERQKLRELLHLKGITKSVLMPSFDHVAAEITSGNYDWTTILEAGI